MAQPSDPHVLDQPWRVWASIAVFGTFLSGAVLGVLIIPVVQGRSDGIDAFTAICRALGILPGSPARQQVIDRTPPSPVSQVVWTPGVLQILADAKPERGRAKAQEVCVACHGEQGVSGSPEYPHLAGQSGAAIYKQLNDYRTGSRSHQDDRREADAGRDHRTGRLLSHRIQISLNCLSDGATEVHCQ